MYLVCNVGEVTYTFLARLVAVHHLSSAILDPPICEAKANSNKCAQRICDPVARACASIEGRLY